MKRREFVRDLLLVGGALACRPNLELAAAMPPALQTFRRDQPQPDDETLLVIQHAK